MTSVVFVSYEMEEHPRIINISGLLVMIDKVILEMKPVSVSVHLDWLVRLFTHISHCTIGGGTPKKKGALPAPRELLVRLWSWLVWLGEWRM